MDFEKPDPTYGILSGQLKYRSSRPGCRNLWHQGKLSWQWSFLLKFWLEVVSNWVVGPAKFCLHTKEGDTTGSCAIVKSTFLNFRIIVIKNFVYGQRGHSTYIVISLAQRDVRYCKHKTRANLQKSTDKRTILVTEIHDMGNRILHSEPFPHFEPVSKSKFSVGSLIVWAHRSLNPWTSKLWKGKHNYSFIPVIHKGWGCIHLRTGHASLSSLAIIWCGIKTNAPC